MYGMMLIMEVTMKVTKDVLDDLWKLRDEYMFIHDGDDSLYAFLTYLSLSDKEARAGVEKEVTESDMLENDFVKLF